MFVYFFYGILIIPATLYNVSKCVKGILTGATCTVCIHMGSQDLSDCLRQTKGKRKKGKLKKKKFQLLLSVIKDGACKSLRLYTYH